MAIPTLLGFLSSFGPTFDGFGVNRASEGAVVVVMAGHSYGGEFALRVRLCDNVVTNGHLGGNEARSAPFAARSSMTQWGTSARARRRDYRHLRVLGNDPTIATNETPFG